MVISTRARTGGWPWVRVYRGSAGLAVVLVLFQATMAGQTLSGNRGALALHSTGSNLLVLVAVVLGVSAVAARRRHSLPPGPGALVAVTVPLLVILQAWAGYARWLDLHVPLGVSLLGLTLWLLLVDARPRRR